MAQQEGITGVAAAIQIEQAGLADLAALGDLREVEGWARTETLLQALLTWEHGRIFVLRERAVPGGDPASELPLSTVSAIATGPVGVIGNVIVRHDFRRRGLSRVVMEASLDWLRLRGVRSVFLDATPDGRPVYERLGFVPVIRSWASWTPLHRLDGAALADLAGTLVAEDIPPEALRRLSMLDQAAFGGDRLGLMELLLREPGHQLYAVSGEHGEIAGYALSRMLDGGRHGLRLGPWVAKEPATAAALLRAALAPHSLWDAHAQMSLSVSLPESNHEALRLLGRINAHGEEDDVIMRLDFDHPGEHLTLPGEHPEWVYGWLAPMVF